MYLKSIELSGFKSFAKKSELLFTSRVSAIVGPNGSGKSNVAEAFRFVLGEQSIKSLRGKKGEDLIFNGAGGEARANRASVKVVFDNADKTFSIDFPEVSIERVVHRDGINEYFINGSSVRLKDIVELLAQANIGASGHHIISQGEADRILNASTKERKAMIEDALGLKIYQYKRVESERKLKKTFENIAQVESLRKEIAPHLKFLRKQVEKLEKAASMQDELVVLASEYFAREHLYISLQKKERASEKAPLEKELEKLAHELKDARAILEKTADKKEDFAVLELEAETASTRAHKDALVRELGKIEGFIAAEERIIQRQRQLQESDHEKTIKLRDVEEMYEDIIRHTTNVDALDASSLVSLLKEVTHKIAHFIQGKREVHDSSAIIEAEKQITEYSKERERLEKDIVHTEQKEVELRERLETLKREIEKEKDSSRDAEKAVFRIMSEENEILAKLNVMKVEEEKLGLLSAEFERDLQEVSRLIGADALKYREKEFSSDEIFAEPRQSQEDRKRTIERLKIRLEDSGVSGGDETLKEFKEVSERDEFLARELLDLEKSAESLKVLIRELEERLSTEFSSGISRINKEFGGLFSTMFGGGHAELTLVKEKKKKKDALLEGVEIEGDLDDEEGELTEEGLDISVNLPRKKIKGLMMLSGGERALTSIALLFAISAVNPPPFIILDETDAALDEANSKKYGDLAEKLSDHSQLILITHNRETMSRAGVIYGVTMSSTGVSKLLSIEFDQAVEVAK